MIIVFTLQFLQFDPQGEIEMDQIGHLLNMFECIVLL